MKIAIVGSGISGIVSAYLLSEDHEVILFEANDYVGGHTHTIDVVVDGVTYPVDTGFIVFNEVTYPNFVKLLKRLNVPYRPSTMSFSVTCEQTGLEYRPSSLDTLFSQRSNLVKPSFHRMLIDIFRFRQDFDHLVNGNNHTESLGEYLARRRYSRMFIERFIIPMGAAIWSADPGDFEAFPVRSYAQFFKNHGLLTLRRQPQWYVLDRGSRSYVDRILATGDIDVRLSSPVAGVQRFADHVMITARDGQPERFDHVVLATHSDQALALLSDPTDAEREVLGAIPYLENRTLLHTDTSVLPTMKKNWSSWNVRIPRDSIGRVAMTYDMNILQGIQAPAEFCVSLNLQDGIDPDKVIADMVYHHPVYTRDAFFAHTRYAEISGVNRTWYAGAYWGYGFHEDGVRSALRVAEAFGKSLES